MSKDFACKTKSPIWDYRLVRVGPIDQPINAGFLRIHKVYYRDAAKTEISEIDTKPSLLWGSTLQKVLEEVELMLDGVLRPVLRVEEIKE